MNNTLVYTKCITIINNDKLIHKFTFETHHGEDRFVMTVSYNHCLSLPKVLLYDDGIELYDTCCDRFFSKTKGLLNLNNENKILGCCAYISIYNWAKYKYLWKADNTYKEILEITLEDNDPKII